MPKDRIRRQIRQDRVTISVYPKTRTHLRRLAAAWDVTIADVVDELADEAWEEQITEEVLKAQTEDRAVPDKI